MRKLIAAINMTLDGFCDHTVIIPDEEIHQHYAELLDSGRRCSLWKDNLSAYAILANSDKKSFR